MDAKENRSLKDLLAKINHPLLEIRTRSLRSVIFKLRNNIIQATDLVKETSFLASLLEWFNFEEWALESQVLGLLSELSQHEAAVQTLVDLGGVEFLSQLRLHCDPSLHPLVDEALEHMMMLPSSLVGLTPHDSHTPPTSITPSSSNSRLTTDTTSDIGSYTPTRNSTLDPMESAAGGALTSSLPPQYPERAVSKGPAPHQSPTGADLAANEAAMVRPHLVGTDAHSGMSPALGPPPLASKLTTSSSAVPLEGHSRLQPAGTNQENWDGGGVFPWLLLSTTDIHIMATTNHRLQVTDYSKLCQCCTFISEVLLQDYPPELFLQRPAIVHSLMSLLQRSDDHSVHVLELRCLLTLTSRLKGRLTTHLQPALRVSDRLTAGRVCPVVIGNTNEAPQVWSDDLENFSPEILNHLQQEQLSLSQYCHHITEHTCALLLTCLNNDFQLGADDDNMILQCVSTSVQLLSANALLLEQLSMNTVYMATAVLENSLLKHVSSSLEYLGSALSHCLSKWRRMTPRDGRAPVTIATGSDLPGTPPSFAQLMVTLATVHLAYSLSTTISCLPESTALPSTVGGVICDLVMNGLLSACYPDLVQVLLPHVRRVDPPTYQLRMKIQSYVDSFQSMFTFLKTFRTKPTASSELLSLSEQGLLGLYFVSDEEAVSSIVDLCITIPVEQGTLVCQTTAHHLLLKLLSHGSLVTQRMTLEYFQASLAHPGGGSLTSELLKEDILQELCTRALLSVDDSVSSACGRVLSHLIMQEGKKAAMRMAPWQLYIEAGTGKGTEPATLMYSIFEKEEIWSDTEKVQCLLRNMFSKNRDCRVWAFSILSKLLIAAPLGKVSPFSVEPHVILHDIFLLGKPSPREQDIVQHTVFCTEDVTKLLHILQSPTMDQLLKISAIEHLATVLLDYSLHDSALEESVVSSVNGLLSCCLNDLPLLDHQATGANSIRLFKPCVRSLGLIVHSSGLARRELAVNKEFLLDVLRGALLWHTDLELLFDVSRLLCFLLFETVAQYCQPTEGSGVKFPEGILNRLQLPFPVDVLITESPNKLPVVLETEVCFSEPVHGMLRLAYHTSKAGCVGTLLSHIYSSKEGPVLSQYEALMLRALDWGTAFRETTQAIQLAGDQWKAISAHLSTLELIGCLQGRCGDLKLDWEEALQGPLGMHPTNISEEHVLESVLLCLCTAVGSMSSAETQWIIKATLDPHSVCFKLMQASLQEHSERQPQKSLLRLCGSLLERSHTIPVSYIPGLVKMFCRCLDVAGSPKYYDLPLLELSLHCLLHLSRIAVMMVKESSFEWLDSHMSVMATLRQVLCSFLVGRGSAGTTSFMGKGVSAKVAVALAHFLHSVKFQNPPQGWCCLWLKDPACTSFKWLLSLIKDRDPNVQYGGFSILSLLCSEVPAAQIVLQELENINSYGIWGECLSVGLDMSEATLVRQQAIGVLTALIVLCSENKKWDELLVLSLPQATVKGPKALRVLVDQYDLFATFKCMLSGVQQVQDLKKACRECCSLSKAAFPAAATSLINGALSLHDPYIIWGTCQLLHNLLLPFPQYVTFNVLKQGMLKLAISMLSSEILQFITTAYGAGLIRPAAFGSWLSMFEAIVILLRSLLLHSEEILPHLLKEECVVSLCRIIPCLTALIYSKGAGVDLCAAVMAILHTMGYRASYHQLETLFTTIQLQWEGIVGLIQHTLGDLKDVRLHQLAGETLKLFSLFICASSKPLAQTHPFSSHSSPSTDDPVHDAMLGALKELLDGKETKSPPETIYVRQGSPGASRRGSPPSDGRRLCEALLRAHDELPPSVLSRSVISALSLLVACSSTAKQAALECGFLESSIDHLLVLHKKLSAETVESSRRQDSPHIAELITVVSLIRNLLYRSFDSKAAALSSHLPTVVQKIWPWCCTSRRLMVSVLQLLCVLCAQHPPARTALSTGMLHSILRQVTRYLGGMSSSAKPLGVHGDVLKAAFTLLATTALSSECRAVMKKVGFLQSLSQLNPRGEKGNHSKLKPSCLWIKLLVNLSFSTEGQSMIVKTAGYLDFLVDMHWNGGGTEQIQCLLVLRNLCFHQQSKTILSTSEMVATLFSCALDSGESKQLILAASGIWALLFNCNKVKNSLRRNGLHHKLEQANLTCKAAGRDNPQVLNTLSTALNLLQ